MSSNLSSLLNPAPPSSYSVSPPQQSADRPASQHGVPPALTMENSPSHKRKDSITSPGLDALAAVASSSARLEEGMKAMSPPSSSYSIGPGFLGRRVSQGASEGLPPSHPFNPEGLSPSHPPHPPSESLPPYQSGLDQLGEAAAMQGREEGAPTTQIRQPLSDPSARPDQEMPSLAVPDTQSEQVQVKTEVSDAPMTMAQGPATVSDTPSYFMSMI